MELDCYTFEARNIRQSYTAIAMKKRSQCTCLNFQKLATLMMLKNLDVDGWLRVGLWQDLERPWHTCPTYVSLEALPSSLSEKKFR